MCVIAVSKKGTRIPTTKEFKQMWDKNPDGCGFMFNRNNRVIIHKGFMQFDDFIRCVHSCNLSKNDSAVFHFRIATQAGINPFMCHPFPVTDLNINLMKCLDLYCDIGVAHNGIIPLTTDKNEHEYSDTALFAFHYLSRLVRSSADMQDEYIKNMIAELGQSKFAMLDYNGNVETIGTFFDDNGVLLSNQFHKYYFTKTFYTERVKNNVLCI